jgi:phosphatidate cytidylyltransferase
MAGDTAGYFVGSRFGYRRIYPRISPNKTLEGTLGVLIAGVLTGLLGSRLLVSDVSLLEAFGLSLLLSLLGQGGDLFESWIKRSFSVKDSGGLLPGHGGILDRMDSLVFPSVMTAHYVKLFHS